MTMLGWASRDREERGMTMPVIDVHTHMLNQQWLELLRRHGKPRYAVQKSMDAPEGIFLDGAPFMAPQEGHSDYDGRIRAMDAARVDIAILSLTCPNVYWGGAEVSHEAARIVNDDMARAEKAYPGRIRWMASLPWQYPELAVAELRRACDRGAVGVMVLANIDGRSLTDPLFAPLWQEIGRRAVHRRRRRRPLHVGLRSPAKQRRQEGLSRPGRPPAGGPARRGAGRHRAAHLPSGRRGPPPRPPPIYPFPFRASPKGSRHAA